MVRLLTNKGKIVGKRFASADEARNWFSANNQRYGPKSTASIITEARYKKIKK